MKFSNLLFALLVVIIASSGDIRAQWTQTSGPPSDIRSLAVNGTDIFAGTIYGAYRSTDNGTSWTAINTGLGIPPNSMQVQAFAISGSNIFAGMDAGVYLSTNSGTSWTSVSSGLNYATVSALAISGGNLFAGTYSNGVYLSTNNGTSWIAVDSGLTSSRVYAFCVVGSALYAATDGGIFVSTNSGTSWTSTGYSGPAVTALAFSDTSFFAGTFGAGIYLSSDTGKTWTPANSGLTRGNITALGISGSSVFAGTDGGGIFLSTNNGGGWTAVNSGVNAAYVHAFAFSGGDVFAGTSGGFFLSANNGASWTASNSGSAATYITTLASNGSNMFAGTALGGIFLSSDNGANWKAVDSGMTSTSIITLAIEGTNIFAGTNDAGVFLSTNNGTSWTAVHSGMTAVQVWTIAADSTDVFAGTSGGAYHSTNNGTSWTAVDNGLTSTNVRAIAINDTGVFAATSGGGVFRSTDKGANWTAVNTGLTNSHVYSLVVIGSNIFAGTNGGGVFRSSNNGASWSAATNLPSPYVNALGVEDSVLFASTTDISVSTDDGASWTSAGGVLNGSAINAFTFNGANVFAGTSSSAVWLAPLSALVPPPAPTLILPLNGAVNLLTTDTLVCRSVNGGIGYNLNVATNTAFSPLTIYRSGADTSYVVGPLVPGTTYYWRMQVNTAYLSSQYSQVDSFTVMPLPGAPVLASPASNTTNERIDTVTLRWHPVLLDTGYVCQVSSSPSFSSLVASQDTTRDTAFTVTSLQHLTTYYWRVLAYNAVGSGSFSATDSFTTIVAMPSAPVPASPAANAFNQPTSLTLKVTPGANAAGYRWQVSTSSTFSPLVVDDSTSGAGDTANSVSSLQNLTKYYWRVLSYNVAGQSSFSSPDSFTTIVAAAAVPVTMSPAANATNQPTSLTLKISPAANAAGYHWQVSTSSTFSPPVVDDSTSGAGDTANTVSSLQNLTKYYWRVLSYNVAGQSSFSSPDSFTTIVAAAAVPVTVSPAANAINQPTSLTLKVSPAANAAGYHWQVSTNSSFSPLAVDDSTSGAGDTANTVSSLQNLTKYYWRVLAYNAAGASAFSSPDSFTTIIALPSTPVAVYPAAGAVNQPVSLMLKTNSVANAAGYHWQVSTSSGFSPLVVDDSTSGAGDTANSVSSLQNSTRYYWRVLAYNIAGGSSFSPADSFSTIVASAGIPVAVSPAANAINQPTSLTLKVTPAANAAGYHWQVSTSSTFSPLAVDDSTSGAGDTANTVSSLQNLTKYYWRVLSYNVAGQSSFSSPDSFTTIVAAAAVPVTVSPAANATNQPTSLTLKVTPVANAAGYHWQVSTSSTFSPLAVDDSTSGAGDTANTVSSLQNLTKYYWRVLSYNVAGQSSFSSPDSFTTIVAAPAIPVAVLPAANATNQPTSLTLKVTPVANAAGYHWQVSTNSGFSPLVVDDSTSGTGDTANSVSSLQNLTKYYWRVLSYNAAGPSSFSSPDSFTTIIAVPSVPIQVSPLSGAANILPHLTIKIDAVANAAGYHWQVSSNSGFPSPVVDDSTTGANDTLNAVTLTAGTKYFWRVQSFDLAGASAFSSPDSFTVMAVPAVPLLASPANNASFVRADTLVLQWHSVSGDTGYVCQISAGASFSSLVASQDTTRDTSFTVISLQNLTRYYWRVLAYNAAGSSSFSLPDSFTTIIAKPSTPTIASSFPTTGAPRLPTFAWNPSARATTYRFQLDSDSTFSTFVVDTTSPDTSVRISDTLRANTTYFWHVSAIDTAGASPYTTLIRFTTGTATGVDQLDGIPTEYALWQNYPNPFNPTTTIRFDLKQPSNVTLKIYDIIGQEVLVKDYGMMKAGRFNEVFTMSREASGVYIYRIVAKGVDGETFVAVKKMLELK